MKHLEDIKLLVKTLQASEIFHALVIESPPGWAKSSTIDRILRESELDFVSLGNYSTPLCLYNAICKTPDKLLVIDDCAGFFGEQAAMSVLKAATWSSAGSSGERQVSWYSNSDKVKQASVKFSGKLILLTNTLPTGRDMDAFLSRTLYLRIAFDVEEVEKMLSEAAQVKEHYPDTEVAFPVLKYLLSNIQKYDLRKLNLRTLKMGYEIAKANPTQWQPLLDKLLPRFPAKELARSLLGTEMNVEEQSREFSKATGLSRRTFFNYRSKGRQELGQTPPSPILESANCTTPLPNIIQASP